MTDAPAFHIEILDAGADDAGVRQVRDAVFVAEQGIAPALEHDGHDLQCRHVLARDAQQRAIGTGRISPDGRIGRMAVLPQRRGQGVGAAMLAALVHLARQAGLARVHLHAQTPALAFYARHGFSPDGAVFHEAGLPHQAMSRALETPDLVTDRAGAVRATCAVIQAARRQLWLYTRDLDPEVYDSPAVLDALRALATAGPHRQVRILLQAPDAVQRSHAPLLPLAQRLPSVFALRAVEDAADLRFAGAFAVNDAAGYYQRPLGHRFDGDTHPDKPGRSRQLIEAFAPVWERARPCSELRALGL